MNLNNFYYRVDNLRHNSLVVKGVVKKAGSGLATPMMTAEQKEWWKKTVGKKRYAAAQTALHCLQKISYVGKR